jgi:hypothetical protein
VDVRDGGVFAEPSGILVHGLAWEEGVHSIVVGAVDETLWREKRQMRRCSRRSRRRLSVRRMPTVTRLVFVLLQSSGKEVLDIWLAGNFEGLGDIPLPSSLWAQQSY